jgi:hypothetical protein
MVNEPSAAVVSFVRNHPPHAMDGGQCCGTSKHGEDVIVTMVSFGDLHIPSPDIASAELQMSVARRTETTAWVRADAQVVWRGRRDPAERVPATDRAIVITRTPADPTLASTRIAVTDKSAVEHVQHVFNALLVARPGPHSCPQIPSYRLEFRATKTSPTNVVATIRCGDVSVTVGGGTAATLDAAGLESDVGALFGD